MREGSAERGVSGGVRRNISHPISITEGLAQSRAERMFHLALKARNMTKKKVNKERRLESSRFQNFTNKDQPAWLESAIQSDNNHSCDDEATHETPHVLARVGRLEETDDSRPAAC